MSEPCTIVSDFSIEKEAECGIISNKKKVKKSLLSKNTEGNIMPATERNKCNKMSKKIRAREGIVSLILASLMILSLASCGGKTPATTTASEQTKGEPTNVENEKNELQVIDTSDVETFKNPLITPNTKKAWSSYGVGDPFVMRWNGTYYLYCSTKDGNRGIQVWTSPDLVNWEYGGYCNRDKETTGAYAPEVTYYNGYFYMVTSPAGNGHYTLRSESPLGPFELVTGNWGHSIDGHIFIDNDGKWYFYSAGSKGIMMYTMSSPTQVSDYGDTVGAYMGDWTEGPMVIYYNGMYYLTYTGNHVWSRGYRIDYATSAKNPRNFAAAKNSPLLVSTEDDCYGIGHSSTVMGPNLDSYYIVYHTTAGSVPQRDMRIDRLVFNGKHMEVLGPTVDSQQKPQMPDAYSYFTTGSDASAFDLGSATLTDGGLALPSGAKVLTNSTFADKYTMEANFMSIGGNAGIIFGYTDDNNYGKAIFDTANSKLVVTFVVNGEPTVVESDLVKSFKEDYNFNALQMLTVKRDGDSYTFFVNSRELLITESKLDGGKCGVTSESGDTVVGFTGVSAEANQSSIRDYFKPIEGRLEAITCMETEYTTKGKKNAELSLVAAANKYFNYTVNVSKTGKYDIMFEYEAENDTDVEIYQNGKLLTTVKLTKASGSARAFIAHDIELEKGMGTISFRYLGEGVEVIYYDFTLTKEVTAISLDFAKGAGNTAYSDGNWKVKDGQLVLGETGSYGAIGKILYGDKGWANYTISADITPTEGNLDAGLAVRVTNPATGEDNNLSKGSSYYEGYYIALTAKGVSLAKVNYEFDEVKLYKKEMKLGETHNLKVQAEDATIRVWLDGELVIEYTDKEPYAHGMAGMRGYCTTTKYDNLVIEPS